MHLERVELITISAVKINSYADYVIRAIIKIFDSAAEMLPNTWACAVTNSQ